MSGLLGNVLAGAIQGGAASRLDQLRKEAEQLRAENLRRLDSELRRGDARFANEMAVEREDSNYTRDRADALADQDTKFVQDSAEKASEREHQKGLMAEAIALEDKKNSRNQAGELSNFEAKKEIEKKFREPKELKDNTGDVGKMIRDMKNSGQFSDEEIRAAVLKKTQARGLTEAQELRAELELAKMEDEGVDPTNIKQINTLRTQLGKPELEAVLVEKGQSGILGIGKTDDVVEYQPKKEREMPQRKDAAPKEKSKKIEPKAESLPEDRSNLVPGTTYMSAKGSLVTWDGKGFKAVK